MKQKGKAHEQNAQGKKEKKNCVFFKKRGGINNFRDTFDGGQLVRGAYVLI